MSDATSNGGASSALNRSLHWLAAIPAVYDAIQLLAGRPIVAAAIRRWLAQESGLVIDIGGGTGYLKTLLPRGMRHVCIDVEIPKLRRYVAKSVDAMPVAGDVMNLPLRTGSVDHIALVAVSHHLSDEEFELALRELARVLRPTGVLFFFDALWAPEFRVSRLLWHRDRGAHPRTREQLIDSLHRHFRVVDRIAVTAWHRYLGCRCQLP